MISAEVHVGADDDKNKTQETENITQAESHITTEDPLEDTSKDLPTKTTKDKQPAAEAGTIKPADRTEKDEKVQAVQPKKIEKQELDYKGISRKSIAKLRNNKTLKYTEIDNLTTRKRERKDSPEERSAAKKSQQDDMTNPIATVIGHRTELRDQRGSQPSDSQTNNSSEVTRDGAGNTAAPVKWRYENLF